MIKITLLGILTLLTSCSTQELFPGTSNNQEVMVYINENQHDNDYLIPEIVELKQDIKNEYPPYNCKVKYKDIKDNFIVGTIQLNEWPTTYGNYLFYDDKYILLEENYIFKDGKKYKLRSSLTFKLAKICGFSNI